MNGDDFIKLNFERNPKEEDDKELIFTHSLLHTLFKTKAEGSPVVVDGEKRTLEDLVNYHALVVQEMKARKIKHVPHDDLDRRTYDLLGWTLPGELGKSPRLFKVVVQLANPLENRDDLNGQFEGLHLVGWEDLAVVRKALDAEGMTVEKLAGIIDEVVGLQRQRMTEKSLLDDFEVLEKLNTRNLNLLLALMRSRRDVDNPALDEVEAEVEKVLRGRFEAGTGEEAGDTGEDTSEGVGEARGSTEKAGDESPREEDTPEGEDVDKGEGDAYEDIPDESKTYDFIVQEHFRGKSVHADLRFESGDPKLLLGWTLNTQIAGAIDEPVTTLAEAKKRAANASAYSKVDFKTGEFAKRKGTGNDVQVVAERKAPHPRAWLDVEGRTKAPVEGEPPPVGATRQFPGVWNIVDRGTIEFGAQRPDLHEYFLNGRGLDFRVVFRKLKAEALRGKSEGDVVSLAEALDDDEFEEAEVVIPAAEGEFTTREVWVLIKPKNETPYVLSNRAERSAYIPEEGRSALPAEVRKRVPEALRFWKFSERSKRLEVRRELRDAIKAGEVDLGIREVEKGAEQLDLSGNSGFFLTSPPLFASDEREFLRSQVHEHAHSVELDEDGNGLSSVEFGHCHAVEDLTVEEEEGHSHGIANTMNATPENQIEVSE